MARRASSSNNPILIIGIIAAVAALIFGGKILISKKPKSYTNVNPLVAQDLLDNGNSLRNNEYLIEGKIDERFFRDGNTSSVVSVRINAVSGEEIVPVVIPSKFNKLNIEREQRYTIIVRFEQGGIPVATDINRL